MLLGAPMMVALVRHGGDDARLRIAPAVTGDAGAFADGRARAIGGDQQPRGYCFAVRQSDVDAMQRTAPRVLPPPERGRVGVGVGIESTANADPHPTPDQ